MCCRILAMEEHLKVIDELTIFLQTQEMPMQTKLACEEIIEELNKIKVEKAQIR
jgi:CO dehydrogenase/acetyl-CoA synthase beta subunit